MQGTLLQVALHETLTKSDDSHIVHCYGACDDFVMEEKHIYLEYVDGSDLFELASKFFLTCTIKEKNCVGHADQFADDYTFIHLYFSEQRWCRQVSCKTPLSTTVGRSSFLT